MYHRLLPVLVLVPLLCGCSGGTYPVHGKVVWKDGTPATELAGSNVVFEGVDGKNSALGSIQADASFQLMTNNPNDGAPAGDYKVLVTEVGLKPAADGDGSSLAPGILHTRYSTPSTTDLTATVKPGTNQVTLTVERNPAP